MKTVTVQASDIRDKLSERLVREFAEGRARVLKLGFDEVYRPVAAWEAAADRLLSEGFFYRVEEQSDCAGWPWINAAGVRARRTPDGDVVRVEYEE